MATLLYVLFYLFGGIVFCTLAEKIPAINNQIEKIVDKITEV